MGIINKDFLRAKMDLSSLGIGKRTPDSSIQKSGGFIKMIVGLGNAGHEYDGSRHNIGFAVLDNFAAEYGFDDFKLDAKFKCSRSEKFIAGCKIILVKPTTYMNLSGEAVAALASFYKIEIEDILVVHDELDLDFGDIKLKQGGEGRSSHNGLKSVSEKVGNHGYWRLKIGVNADRGQMSGSDFVLARFSKAEEADVENYVNQAAKIVLSWAS